MTVRIPRWAIYLAGLAVVVGVAVVVTLLLVGREGARLATDCRHAVEQPERVILTCGDGNFYAEALDWNDWGDTIAVAEGTAAMNACEPSCAEGSYRYYPVRLEASRLRTCPDGDRQYARVAYAFPAQSPFPPDSPGATMPTVDFECP